VSSAPRISAKALVLEAVGMCNVAEGGCEGGGGILHELGDEDWVL
jgi:hypothetical protein